MNFLPTFYPALDPTAIPRLEEIESTAGLAENDLLPTFLSSASISS
jgi:hypothetical protein